MIVLDTNVLSELMRRAPNDRVLAWMDATPATELYVSAVTVAEILYGIGRLPAGARKDGLLESAWSMLEGDFARRILPFDAAAAAAYASLVVDRERAGRPITMPDAQIAGICASRGASLATRNLKDFDGLGLHLLDPWQAAGPA